MKKSILFFAIALLSLSFLIKKDEERLAKVSEVDGIYIYSDSKPVDEYIIIGDVSSTFRMNSSYVAMKKKLIKKAKSQFLRAEGIIIYPTKAGIDKADVIIFKE